MAVWTAWQQDNDPQEGVFGQLFLSTGTLLGAELHVNTTTVNRQFHPVITSNGEDRFLTGWSGFVPRNGFDLFSQVYLLSIP